MKKYFLIVLFIFFVAPSIAFASWWNPFSWFDNWNFKKEISAPVQVEVEVEVEKNYEDKISEMEAEIAELKNTQQAPTSSLNTIQKSDITIPKTIEIKPTIVPTEPALLPASQSPTQVDIPAQWLKPDGSLYTPEEIADNIAKELIKQREESDNDYDIYNVSHNSGISYTPEQLNEIDCAYYNINCPTVDIRIIDR